MFENTPDPPMTIIDNTLNADGALIVGAGLAGMFTALKLAPRPVTVLSSKPLGTGGKFGLGPGRCRRSGEARRQFARP
ncbi:MAG: hypothetical protein MO852_04770 [Candidatus Devosia euplotis]|nr:hypothetical protein [Candidatus Devosia euplotis]